MSITQSLVHPLPAPPADADETPTRPPPESWFSKWQDREKSSKRYSLVRVEVWSREHGRYVAGPEGGIAASVGPRRPHRPRSSSARHLPPDRPATREGGSDRIVRIASVPSTERRPTVRRPRL